MARNMEDRIKELEKRWDEQFRKLAIMIEKQGAEVYSFRQFLESSLILLLTMSMTDSRVERLAMLLKAATNLPFQGLEFLVKDSVRVCHSSGLAFEELANVLVKRLGESAKKLRLNEAITKYYDIRAAERWNQILRGLNPGNHNKEVRCVERYKSN